MKREIVLFVLFVLVSTGLALEFGDSDTVGILLGIFSGIVVFVMELLGISNDILRGKNKRLSNDVTY